MAVIKEYMSGNCKITVHDDYITHDPDEIKRIIDRVSRIVIDAEIRRAKESKQPG